MVILPALSTSTRAIPTPAAATARIARVTSCCRNVEGARAMGVNKSAYEASLEVIQPVAGRPECWPAVEEVGDVGGCDTDGCFRLVRCGRFGHLRHSFSGCSSSAHRLMPAQNGAGSFHRFLPL